MRAARRSESLWCPRRGARMPPVRKDLHQLEVGSINVRGCERARRGGGYCALYAETKDSSTPGTLGKPQAYDRVSSADYVRPSRDIQSHILPRKRVSHNSSNPLERNAYRRTSDGHPTQHSRAAPHSRAPGAAHEAPATMRIQSRDPGPHERRARTKQARKQAHYSAPRPRGESGWPHLRAAGCSASWGRRLWAAPTPAPSAER